MTPERFVKLCKRNKWYDNWKAAWAWCLFPLAFVGLVSLAFIQDQGNFRPLPFIIIGIVIGVIGSGLWLWLLLYTLLALRAFLVINRLKRRPDMREHYPSLLALQQKDEEAARERQEMVTF